MISSPVVELFGPHARPRDDELDGVDWDYMLAEPEPLDWAVENTFLTETVGLISGNGGAGKTTLLMQLAICATLGLPWLGLNVKPARALMLCCEDDRRIVRLRQRWICRAIGRDMTDLAEAGVEIIPRTGFDNTLMALDRASWSMKPTPLMETLKRLCRRQGIQMVIIDTVSRTFGGQNFNERQVVQYIDEMLRLAEMIRGVVLLTQHPSMAGRKSGTGESGTVQWENATRSRLYVHKHQALGLVIDGMKANYAAKAAPMKIEWKKGVFVRCEPPQPRDYTEAGEYS